MKKITFLLMLITITFGYSQDLILGFEAGESGGVNGGPFGDMPAPTVLAGTGSNTSQVLEIIGNTSGQPWQGINLNLSENVDLTSTQTMTIDVKSATPITFLVKVNGGLAGAPEAAAEVTHNGNDTWQTLSFTFNTSLDGQAAMANGVYASFVIHAYWEAGETTFFPGGAPIATPARTFYVDNIMGPANVDTCSNGMMDGDETGVDCGGSCPNACITPPAISAPVPPARAPGDVFSIYSDVYTDFTVDNFDQGWCGGAHASEVMIAGNPTLKKNMGIVCQGIDFSSNKQDLSGFTHIHFDFWVADTDLTGDVFNVKLVDFGGGGSEASALEVNINGGTTPALVAGSWVSVDVDITSLMPPVAGSLTRSDIAQIGITTANVDNLWFDNIYLHKNTTLSNDEFTQASFKVFPNPSEDSWTVTAQNEQIESINVYDVLGKQVLRTLPSVSETRIDGSALKSGLYFAQIRTASGLSSIRLVKK
ncbi:T9SS type A sorting domain-containing protein [Hyunsoonleella sp. SJ7]|uniref:T9SS type A sorting domain-containing protein n=1 Tax=Hyunsoonleella aquatilis TaxID=2762758 RepID=A0A923HAA7_9FLAO|nr:T9SS type A sorting domain-containing protein [Hyunsoonleella aquatilis]MBC3757424.1 T9SS type A sorting domain-containing protein [Hyunsoonleella aquatilis]